MPPVAPALKLTVTAPLSYGLFVPTSETDDIDGACGTVVAVIELDALEASPVPAAFVPVTVKVYEVPDCRPVTVIGEDAPVAVYPPGEDVTV